MRIDGGTNTNSDESIFRTRETEEVAEKLGDLINVLCGRMCRKPKKIYLEKKTRKMVLAFHPPSIQFSGLASFNEITDWFPFQFHFHSTQNTVRSNGSEAPLI